MAAKRKRGAKDGANGRADASKKVKKAAGNGAIATAEPVVNLEHIPFVETPIGEERKREAALYDLLGNEDDSERIKAADCIISCLLEGDGVEEPVLQRHLDRRLFRGLSSGRNASRIGFSLVITEILSQLFGEKGVQKAKYPDLTFNAVLKCLTDKVEALGNIPGQEERDHYFGQLFGLESFVKSQTLFLDDSRWNKVLDHLLKLGNKKVWLRSQCGWVLVQALSLITRDQAESTLNRLADTGLAKTPEGVGAWLVALDRHPDLKVKPWRDPLSKKSLGDLAAVLRESFQDSGKESGSGAGNKKQANWTAQLHFVWDLILGHYAGAEKAADEDFEQFWNRVVDDGLFSKSATDGQKFKGFMVFQKFLEGLPERPGKLQFIFSKNLMSCLMNQAAKEDRYLHRAAVKALKAIESATAAAPGCLVTVLENLLGQNGSYNFDQRTTSKTIDRLLQHSTKQNRSAVFDVIRRPIKSLSHLDNDQLQPTLRVYIDYLSKLLNASTAVQENETPSSEDKEMFGPALQELSALAYSQPAGIPQSALTEQIQELCRTRLESALAKLAKRNDDFETFCRSISSIDPSLLSMDETIRTAVKEASARMQKLLRQKTKSQVEKDLTQALAMLHAVSIFQLYNEDPDAIEVLNDLSQYAERLKPTKAGKSDEGTSELLVEILLSMVARPSSLMRQVSQQVFDAFTSQVSAGGIELLTGPLASGESTKGQKELFNTEDDDMDVDEDGKSGDEEDDDDDDEDDDNFQDVEDASDFEIDSDVEFVDLNASKEEDGSDSDEDNEDDEDESEKPQDLDEFLGKILKSHRLDKDVDAESSSSDGDMSDSDMLALDDKLAEVFKQRVQAKPDSKKQKKDAKQSVVNFKHRILDLLDIYIKNEAATNPLAFTLLTPLLNLMRTTSTKPLASRACEIILNYQRVLKKARSNSCSNGKDTTEGPPSDDLTALLVEIHEEAGKDNSHAYAKAASAASLVVASAMYSSDRDSVKQVAAVYAKTQSDWVLGSVKLQNSFFTDWNNWCQNQAAQAKS